jgi:hypothetical protein
MASLITTVLRRKLEYNTDVLKYSWPTSSTRTTSSCCTGQSVAEKMLTHWFTFFLYNFLKDGAKKYLFSLLCHETADGKGTINTI